MTKFEQALALLDEALKEGGSEKQTELFGFLAENFSPDQASKEEIKKIFASEDARNQALDGANETCFAMAVARKIGRSGQFVQLTTIERLRVNPGWRSFITRFQSLVLEA